MVASHGTSELVYYLRLEKVDNLHESGVIKLITEEHFFVWSELVDYL